MSANAIQPYTPTHFVSLDIKPSILSRSKKETFYVIQSLSTFYPEPEPVIHLLGSFGNEYKLCFSKDCISCSCDYSGSFPCKHILFILLSIHIITVKIKPGPLLVYPYEIIHRLTNVSLINSFLCPKADTLCKSHRMNRSLCSFCDNLLDGVISTCFHCSRSFHFQCIHAINNCPSCTMPTDFVHLHNIHNHRNHYNVLSRLKIPLSKKPDDTSLIQQFNREGSMQTV